ncbi:MAG: DNA mismatch endonuclease Vsr [Selenomonadaceae bacterium]|nr:DNA mismatch endonuclease Vsr [Selenomonadaceae bacterium]
MSDVLTREQRHLNMSHIHRKDTKPEEIVRKYLFSKGYRYRKNDSRYPGKPDIVLPKYRTMIFVHGCFWHRHPECRYATTPSTNRDFWQKKFDQNVARDWEVQEQLKADGWHVIVVWECEISRKADREERLQRLERQIREIEERTKATDEDK